MGKWHLDLESPDTPNERGFDFFHGFLGDMMDSYPTQRRHGINYLRRNAEIIEPKGHATELFSEWAGRIGEGVAIVQGTSDAPFFGFAPGTLDGEAKLVVRMRGGSGKGWIEWLPGSDAKSARKSEAFAAEAKAWTERELKIPAQRDESGILRLYLPAGSKPVEIDWIELNSQNGKRRWDF